MRGDGKEGVARVLGEGAGSSTAIPGAPQAEYIPTYLPSACPLSFPLSLLLTSSRGQPLTPLSTLGPRRRARASYTAGSIHHDARHRAAGTSGLPQLADDARRDVAVVLLLSFFLFLSLFLFLYPRVVVLRREFTRPARLFSAGSRGPRQGLTRRYRRILKESVILIYLCFSRILERKFFRDCRVLRN